MAVGQLDFSPLLAGNRNVQQSNQFLAGNLINLGQQVTNSISENNMRKEAETMAPLLARGYQDAFDNLSTGNIGTGMGMIAKLTADSSRNPLLSRMSQQMNSVADNALNNYGAMQRAKFAADNQYGLEATRAANDYSLNQQKFQQQKQLQGKEIASREKIAGMPARAAQSLTPNQQADLIQNVTAHTSKLINGMKDSKDPKEFLKFYEQYIPVRDAALRAGVDASNPYMEAEAADQLKTLSEKIDSMAQRIQKGEKDWPWSKGAMKKELEDYQATFDRISEASQKGIREGKSDHLMQQAPPASNARAQADIPEGTKARNKEGKIITFKNGQWVE